MPADLPFEPHVKSGVAGLSVSISAQTTSVSTTINSGSAETTAILVSVIGPTGVIAYVRMSSEATPTATVTDVPLPCNPNGLIRLFASPVTVGTIGLAVIVTITSSPVTVWFTPGQGGI